MRGRLAMGGRWLAAGLLIYLAVMVPFYGFGGAEESDSPIQGVFLASLVLSLACLWSAFLLVTGWERAGSTALAARIIYAVIALLVIGAIVVAVPAADGPSHYYGVTRDSVNGWPTRWLGWVIAPVAVNALGLLAIFVWPRVANRPLRDPPPSR